MNSSSTKEQKEVVGVEIADLDALLDTPLSFRLHGKIHTMEPIRNIVFLNFVSTYSKVQKEYNDKSISEERFQDTVTRLFQSVCPSITKDDVMLNTPAQTAALFSIIFDHVQGRLTEDKKKILKH